MEDCAKKYVAPIVFDRYREQLQQVEALLADAPDEPSLLKLKQDLTEVITLTEDLVRYQDEEKKVEETAPAPVQAKGPTGGRNESDRKRGQLLALISLHVAFGTLSAVTGFRLQFVGCNLSAVSKFCRTPLKLV